MTSLPPDATETTVERVLERAGGLAYVVDPGPAVLEDVVDILDASTADVDARVLADREQLKTQVEDFILASTLANLLSGEALAVRTRDEFANANLFLFSGATVQLFDLGSRHAAVETGSTEIVTALVEHYDAVWDGADEFRLRTPARSSILDSLDAELGAAARADFTAIVDSLASARGDDADLDEVTIALLVAAKNEALLYDVSKWGEDVGLASKATFSRTKTRLEELGLIATEKVPIDVGRPRLRLKFADERLRNAGADELASVAQGLLE